MAAAVAAGRGCARAQEEEDGFVETPPEFDKDEYPDGINANFLNDKGDPEQMVAGYAGPQGRYTNPQRPRYQYA